MNPECMYNVLYRFRFTIYKVYIYKHETVQLVKNDFDVVKNTGFDIRRK